MAGALSTVHAVAEGEGEQAIVIYNSRLPESKELADYYAKRRQVPAGQVLGFELPTADDISRRDFRDKLQKPLAHALEDKRLWRIRSHIIPATNGQPARVEWRPVYSKIRYAVLCYGVPLRIQADTNVVEEGVEKMIEPLRRNEAAVDNELAWLPLIEQRPPITGPLRNPLFTVTNAAALHPTNGLLLVARLDGPTPEIARGLVDKAIEAETDGLWGRAYFDLRGNVEEGMKLGEDWIRGAAEVSRVFGFETVVDEKGGTFPAHFPMSQIGLYAGWYTETVSGPFARPTVEFMPGAFAYHLHSWSAASLRTTNRNWAGPFLAKGVTATMGCVHEPYLQGTPDVAVFFARFLLLGFSFGEAAYASQNALSWQTTVVGDPLYRPFAKHPQAQHIHLAEKQSKLIEWSHLREVNRKLVEGYPLGNMVGYLEGLDLTKTSAVLQEKLGDLYAAQGKPSSSAHAYREASRLDPSPQQKIRLLLALGEKLTALNRPAEAREVYHEFLKDFPDYPDRAAVEQKLSALGPKPGEKPDPEKADAN